MNNFPLYTSLMTNIRNRDLTPVQKNDFLKKIAMMKEEGHELIYALIKVFYIEHETDGALHIPYGGVLKNKSLTFDLNQLPNKLKQILYKFTKIHIKKMKEDLELEKGRESLDETGC